MTEYALFKKVKCTKYLKKSKLKYVMANDTDKHEEDKYGIKLAYGESITQNLYEVKDKMFDGICVGLYWIGSERKYESVYDDSAEADYIKTDLIMPIKVAKVYYADNKSRLVPIQYFEVGE